MDIKEEPPNNFFKAIKIPLTYILKHKDVNLSKINEVVIKSHKIINLLLFYSVLINLKTYT